MVSGPPSGGLNPSPGRNAGGNTNTNRRWGAVQNANGKTSGG
jgi:hypothetical protein